MVIKPPAFSGAGGRPRTGDDVILLINDERLAHNSSGISMLDSLTTNELNNMQDGRKWRGLVGQWPPEVSIYSSC